MNTPPKKRNNGAANRHRGHRYERRVAARLKAWFPDICTSRAGNRLRDAQGIDLCNKDELKSGQIPISVQCKSSSTTPNIVELFDRLNGPLPVICWSRTCKDKAGRFQDGGEYAILKMDDFMEILEGYLTAKGITKNE